MILCLSLDIRYLIELKLRKLENMKTIKFRAWDKKEHKLVKVSGITWDEDKILDLNIDDISFHKPIKRFELMCFTGTTDMNDQDVYEGDILGGIFYGGRVAYDDELACFVIKSSTKDDTPLYEEIGDLEVIGNIFEPRKRRKKEEEEI